MATQRVHPAFVGVFTFLFAMVWVWATNEISAKWYFLINRVLHNSVRLIDEQPRWGKILQTLVFFSPVGGLLICFLWWGAKRRFWLVPLSFFLGIVAYETYAWLRFVSMMRTWD